MRRKRPEMMKSLLNFVVIAVVAGVGLGTVWWVWRRPHDDGPTPQGPPTVATDPGPVLVKFCGNCHRLPDPEYFPRDAWYAEVRRGFNFYVDSGRSDLEVPAVDNVVAWFRTQAQESLPLTGLLPPTPSPVGFRSTPVSADQSVPMVASVDWEPESDGWPGLRFSDMKVGEIAGVTKGTSLQAVSLGECAHVAVTKLIDLDQDGRKDLLICELGSRLPADHALGKLSYVPGNRRHDKPLVLLEQVGRIADASAADFDGDGDLDLVVAEFGWLKTGRLLLLENVRSTDRIGLPLGAADFQLRVLDPRHGTIHARITDLNADGLPDIVVLISQEFETVEAFINTGNLTFRREVVMPPQDPSFGSCGIELGDIDGDGDMDVVYCNGDTLDSHLVKHYHGVHLLLNEGEFPFRGTRLLTLPGASDTALADLDGDGDLDIAVSAYLPAPLIEQLPAGKYDSLCWLEQTAPLTFQVHPLETGTIGHLGLAAGDFDGNGTIDLAVGDSPGQGWGTIWWNNGAAKE